MSTQRIRGKSRVAANPRFVEKVLDRVAKIARNDKTEPRWHKEMRLGSVQIFDDKLIESPLGVTKCRNIAALPEEQRFDTSAIDLLRGPPWEPSTKHPPHRQKWETMVTACTKTPTQE